MNLAHVRHRREKTVAYPRIAALAVRNQARVRRLADVLFTATQVEVLADLFTVLEQDLVSFINYSSLARKASSPCRAGQAT